MNNKLLTLLGFAAKSGNLSYGFNAATFSASSGKGKLMIVCNDISKKSVKEVRFYGEKHKVKVMELQDVDTFTLTNAVGRKCGILSVNDSSFADAILSLGGNV
ncbi:MAG: ribosomal L7Ae/L30e/S12e/Gadd45 family protein [Clostridia bacterium]|nr:ribosomal L7Ae/L30e/S12e/Gadd45 family protein [Clostridia bacterium]